MTEAPVPRSWLLAIADTANQQGMQLPEFIAHGMGTARSLKTELGRFIVFKRRLVNRSQAEIDGIEWSLWLESNDQPSQIASFRESLTPTIESVQAVIKILHGWLVDEWTPEDAMEIVSAHHGIQPVQ